MDTKTPKGKVKLVESQALEKKGLSLQERLADEKLRDGMAVRQARKSLQACLLALLSFEILFVAYIMLSQGAHALLFTHIPFQLSEWGFVPFVNVALVQTCILIRPIANNLFPSTSKTKKLDGMHPPLSSG